MQRLESGPIFPVQFSRAADARAKLADRETIFDHPKTVVRVGFGYAPILQPGTIWDHRAFRSRWPFNQIVAETVVHPQIPIFSAYGKTRIDGAERFIIPVDTLKVDGRAAGSRIALFRARVGAETVLLIIPCMEIFRFYYGHSTRLAYRILRGDFLTAAHWIYDADASWVGADGSARLELAPSMDIADAYTVARFALDPIGCQRAKAIVTRTMLEDGGSAPIDVLPPFNGPWRVRVRGRWIRYGRTLGFLVFAIVRCEGPLPFQHLSIYGGYSRETVEKKNESVRSDSNHIERRRTIAPLSDVYVESGDPRSQGLPLMLPALDRDDRYPNVPIVHMIRRRRRSAATSAQRTLQTVEVVADAAAISDTATDAGPNPGFFTPPRRRGGVDLHEGRDMMSLYQKALEVLPEIARWNGFTCTVLVRLIDLTEAFSTSPPSRAYLDRKAGVPRKVIVAEVLLNSARSQVIEIQRRPGAREENRTLIVADATLGDIEENRLMKLLAIWTARGHLRDVDGVPMLQNIRLSGANHWEADTPQSYASRILGKLVKLAEDIDSRALD